MMARLIAARHGGQEPVREISVASVSPKSPTRKELPVITTSPLIQIPRPDAPAAPAREPVDLQPSSAYEAITRQMVESLAEDMKEIKSRTNNIFYVVIGGILLDMVTRWLGG
jgi:hypothetical protein